MCVSILLNTVWHFSRVMLEASMCKTCLRVNEGIACGGYSLKECEEQMSIEDNCSWTGCVQSFILKEGIRVCYLLGSMPSSWMKLEMGKEYVGLSLNSGGSWASRVSRSSWNIM